VPNWLCPRPLRFARIKAVFFAQKALEYWIQASEEWKNRAD